jgi:hypothetical protein
MSELSKINIPFGLLDSETQESLKQAKGQIQVFSAEGVWRDHNKPSWNKNLVYRVAPHETPSISWDAVSFRFRWLTRDADGRIFLWDQRPLICNDSKRWVNPAANYRAADAFESLNPGTCDWIESLVRR